MDEAMSVVITAETVRRNHEEIERALADADQAAVNRIGERYEGSFPLVPADGSYEHPALVITGRQDSVLGFNDQWRRYGQWPRATFAVLDRGGHGLFIELAGLHNALVSDWVDRVEAEPPVP
jgi:pimeloyl-ACP methyl ester carboxylesterase